MQDAAWAIVLFGGIPATLIFLFWWICRRDCDGFLARAMELVARISVTRTEAGFRARAAINVD
jgi:hypothetical protein